MRHLPYHVEINAAKYVDRTLNSLSPDDKPTQRMWDDTPDISLLVRLDQFVRFASTTLSPPYVVKVVQNRYGRDRLEVHISPDGRELAALFNDLRRADRAYSPLLQYAPHLAHFFEFYLEHAMFLDQNSSLSPSPSRRYDSRLFWADIYNDLCALLYKDPVLRKLLQVPRHSWSTTGLANLRNLNKSLDHLFSEGHDLTVYHFRLFASKTRTPIRASTEQAQQKADLQEQTSQPEQAQQKSDSQEQTSQQELNRLRACWKRFRSLWATKPAYFPCRPAYVFSIESSLEDGYGIQLTLLFPSASLARDHPIAEQHACGIGNYWVSQATSGKGHFRLTHREPAYFREGWIFGVIRANEVFARQTLKKTLSNLAVKDALARPKHRPSGKYFWLSQESSWSANRKEHPPCYRLT